jgi:hypothetical protein
MQKKNKEILVSILILLSVVVSGSALVALVSCRGEMGCLGLLPIYVVALPDWPLIWLNRWLLGLIAYPGFSFYDIPSFLRFIPALVVPAYTFSLGFLTFLFFTKISKTTTLQEKSDEVRSARRQFFSAYIFVAFFAAIVIFAFSPPGYFDSAKNVMKKCDGQGVCIENFLHSRLSNCQDETKPFLFPLKTRMPEKDGCLLDNFIEQKPLKDVDLWQRSAPKPISEISDQGKAMTEWMLAELDKAIWFFEGALRGASNEKRARFCDSFYEDKDQEKSDRDYCIASLDVVPDLSSGGAENCITALTKQAWRPTSLQKACFSRFVNFQVYFIDESLLSDRFGGQWSYPDFNDRKFKVLGEGAFSMDYPSIGGSSIDQSNFIYESIVRVRYGNVGFDDISIKEVSVGHPIFRHFEESLKARDYVENVEDYSHQIYSYERTGIVKSMINGTDVYLENVTVRRKDPKTGEAIENTTKQFSNVHFVKGNTYIRIGGEGVRNMSDKDREGLFFDIAGSIIKQ